MSPRRDVEGEIYAQLYGEPPEAPADGVTRVISDEVYGWEAPLGPERPPPPPLSRFDAALAGAAAWLSGAKASVHTARPTQGPRLMPAAGHRGLAIGALLAAVLALGVVAVSSGSDERSPSALRIAAAPPPSDPVAQVLASEAREARRERASRRRAARRRAADRAEARRADEAPARESQREATVVCVEGQGCLPPGAVVSRQPDRSSDQSSDGAGGQPTERSGDEPSAGGAGVNVDTSNVDDAGDIDVDVEVDVD